MQPDSSTLATLLRPHLAKLYRLAYRLTANQPDAEDLVQDVLVKICARADEVTSIRDLSPWLGRVLYNHFIDDRRRYGRMPIKLVADGEVDFLLADEAAQPEQSAAIQQYRQQLVKELAKLSEEQRVVLLLHDAEGYKLSEIFELTGTPIGTLKSRLHRARQRLAALMPHENSKSNGTFSDSPACKSTEGANSDVL